MEDRELPANVTRRRGRRRSSGDEALLDEMLEELGIPSSAEKRRNAVAASERQDEVVIELLTPPRPERRGSPARGNGEVITLDLTTPTPPSASRSRLQSPRRRRSRESVVDLLSSDPEESDRSPPDAESEDEAMVRSLLEEPQRFLSPLPRVDASAAALPVRRRLQDVVSETESGTRPVIRVPVRRLNVENDEMDDRDDEEDDPPRKKQRKEKAPRPPKQKKEVLFVAVAMESALSRSEAGEAIAKALEENTYNNKPIPFELLTPFDSGYRSIQFERRGRTPRDGDVDSERYAMAVHYPAEVFLNLAIDRGYDALVRLTNKLREVPCHLRGTRSKVEWGYRVLIVEGADRALINRKKAAGGKRKTTTGTNDAQASVTSFNELHELSFRLFMDTGTHTKFTCDAEATASYVALLTRELIVAAIKPSPQEEFLESVPRVHSFRVLPSNGSTLNAFANAWLRMLQMIPSVSEDRAQRVLDHFPTFQLLQRAYNDPSLSDQEKQELLADKFSGMRYEPAISRRVYRVLSSDNAQAPA